MLGKVEAVKEYGDPKPEISFQGHPKIYLLAPDISALATTNALPPGAKLALFTSPPIFVIVGLLYLVPKPAHSKDMQ